MSRDTDKKIITVNKRLKAALVKHYGGKTLMLHGKEWTAEALVAAFEDEEERLFARIQARAVWLGATSDFRKATAKNHKLRLSLRRTIEVAHGKDSSTYTDFGYSPSAPRKPTTATKAAAAEKRNATRKARGTMGKKQRAKIKGEPPTGAGA